MSAGAPMFLCRPRSSERGFTLLESLLSLVIIAVISIALHNTLSQGIRVWKRAYAERPDVEISILLERITQDLRNAFYFSAEPPLGDAQKFAFFTVPPVPEVALQRSREALHVRYEYHASEKAVYRMVEGLEPALYHAVEEPRKRRLLNRLDHFEFLYYNPDFDKQTDEWVKNWEKKCLPAAVKVNLRYEGFENLYSRIIPVPAGHCETDQK